MRKRKTADESFVLGLDLDGCVADFVGYMRKVYAEWSGKPIESLHPNPTHGLPEWELVEGEYERLHRFAVTQRDLFSKMEPIDGAPQALRRLATEGVWIRVATHRLFIPNFHQIAVEQTIGWLENHDIRYWDLCLIEDKAAIRADLFIEDNPKNIRRLLANKTDTICMTNPTNQDATDITRRAKNWAEAEEMIRKKYYKWRVDRSLKLPERHGMEPEDEKDSEKSDE